MEIVKFLSMLDEEDILNMLLPYMIPIIYIIVILIVVRNVKRRVKDSKNSSLSSKYGQSDIVRKAMTSSAKAPTDTMVKKPVNNSSSLSSGSRLHGDTIAIKNISGQKGLSLMDDRSSDWLATQLREEAKAMVRVSDMFQLKQQHSNNCDAEFIRRFHESNCDAYGIDDGTKK